MLRSKWLLLMLVGSLLVAVRSQAQMKIGNNPTTINRASILELESQQQGLLLTRILDTSSMTALNPPDGMIIYSQHDSALYLRSDHVWKRLVDSSEVAGAFWGLHGNAGDSANYFLGTNDATGLRIGTNGSPALIISGSGAVQVVDSLHVGGNADFGKALTVADSLSAAAGGLRVLLDSVVIGRAAVLNDSLRLNMVRDALGVNDSVLVLGPDHIVRKTSADALGIRTLAGVGGPHVYLGVARDSADFAIDSTSTPQTLIFNVPYASGVSGAARNGLVDSTAQSFAGAKSFRDSMAVGSTQQPASTLDVRGNVGMSIVTVSTTAGYDMTVAGNDTVRTVIVDAESMTGDLANPTYVPVKLPTPVQGRIYTIKKIGQQNDAQLGVVVRISSSTGNIEGNTQMDINNNWTSVTLQAMDGTHWSIVGH